MLEFRKPQRNWLQLIMAFAMLLLVVPWAAAQEVECESVEVENAIFGGFEPELRAVVLNNAFYHVNERTRVVDADGEPIRLESIAAGTSVNFEYCPPRNSTEQPPSGALPNAGVLLWLQAQNTIAPTATMTPTPVGTPIPEPTPQEPLVIDGPIEEIDLEEGLILLPFAVIQVTADTGIREENGEPLELADLAERDFVQVIGFPMIFELPTDGPGDGTLPPLILLEAIEIILLDGMPPQEIVLEGELTEVDVEDQEIRVGREEVDVTDETVIRTVNGEPLRLSQLNVGDLVRVAAVVERDDREETPPPPSNEDGESRQVEGGSERDLVALEIVLLERGNEFVELEGIIHELDPRGRTFVLHSDPTDFIPVVVVATSDTVVLAPDGERLRFEELANGQRVEVHGAWLANISASPMVQARSIKVLRNEVPRDEIRGIIREIRGEARQLVVAPNTAGTNGGEVVVQVGANAEIIRGEQRIRFEELEPGLLIEAEGAWIPTFAPPSLFDAHKIFVLRSTEPTPTRTPQPTQTVTPTPTRTPIGPPEIEFAGPIEQVMAESMMLRVAGMLVQVTSATEIEGRNGQEYRFSDLLPGMVIEVEGRLREMDEPSIAPVVVAREIKVLEANNPPIVVLEGPITEIGRPNDSTGTAGSYVVVEGQRFVVNNNTRIEDVDGSEIPFSSLDEGDFVRISGTATGATNQLAATSIRLLPRAIDPAHVEGVIEEVDYNAGRLVVRGMVIVLTNETEIMTFAGEPGSVEDLTVGSFVEVLGLRTAEGEVTAIFIAVRPDPIGDDEVEFEGVISGITGASGMLVVSGRMVIVTPETELIGPDDTSITIADLRVGLHVEVEGIRVRDAALEGPMAVVEATRIEVKRPGCIEQTVAGAIESISASGERWVVAQQPVRLRNNTTFTDADGNEVGRDAFAVGMPVTVVGCATPNGGLNARHVMAMEILPPQPEPCHPTAAWAGEVTGIDTAAGVLIVRNRTVAVTNETLIIIEEEGRGTLGDIAVGDQAFVAAYRAEGTGFVACRIVVRGENPPPPPEEYRVVGRIATVSTPTLSLTVRDVTIQTSSTTRIVSRTEEEVAFEALEPGLLIAAFGQRTSDGVLLAELIVIHEGNHEPGPPRFVFGPIEALDLPASMTVDGKTIQLTNETEFRGYFDEPIAPQSLAEGDWVRVKIKRDRNSDGTAAVLVAERVRLRAAVIEGINLEENLITVSGGPVSVTTNTLVIDARTDEQLTIEDLGIGDLVRVVLSPLTIYPPQAVRIVRFATPDMNGVIEGFEGVARTGHRDGRPWLGNDRPERTFGYISLPNSMTDAQANTLYDIRARVSSNESNPLLQPVLRLRANMADFEKGATWETDARGPAQFVPGPDGRLYRGLFLPVAPTDSSDGQDRRFFASLDLLSVEANRGAHVEFELESLDIEPISLDRIQVARTVAEDDLAAGAGDWTFSTAPQAHSPARMGDDDGAISMAPVDRDSFGTWTRDTGVEAGAGKIYRGRFLVSTNITNPAEVPQFRLRLNTSRWELAATVNIVARGRLVETATPEGKFYDVYMWIPGSAAEAGTILASLDLLAFEPTLNPEAAVTLERFILEEVEILPE